MTKDDNADTATPSLADVRDQLADLRQLVPELTDRGRLVLWLALRRVERRVADLRRRHDP